jgi:transposase
MVRHRQDRWIDAEPSPSRAARLRFSFGRYRLTFLWTAEEKGRVVAQAVAPGAVVAEVARQYDLIPQQLSNWIKAAKEGRVMLPAPEPGVESAEATDAAFVPVVALRAPETAGADAASCIEIVAGSVLVRVPLGADARTLAAILRAVR